MPDRLPVSAATCTVLGHRYAADSPAWLGLDMAHAELREGSIWGTDDHHLRVPWCHPEDAPCSAETMCWYRVRSRRKGWRFVKVDGAWWVEKVHA